MRPRASQDCPFWNKWTRWQNIPVVFCFHFPTLLRTHWKVSPCILLRDKLWLKPSIARCSHPTSTDRICPRCAWPRCGGWRVSQHRAPSHTGSWALWHWVNSALCPGVMSSTEVSTVSTQPQRDKGMLRSCILSCGTSTGWHSCWHTWAPTTPGFRHRALSASWPQHYNLFLSFCQCSHLLTFQSLLTLSILIVAFREDSRFITGQVGVFSAESFVQE